MTHPAADLYHNLLGQSDAPALAEALFEQMRARRLTFGDRLVCSVLRPFFIRQSDYDVVRSAAEQILSAIARLDRALREDPRLLALVGLTPDEEELVNLPFGFAYPDVSARLDAFMLGPDNFSFIEYNAESPGGLAFGEALGEVFSAFPIMQAVARTYPCTTFPIRRTVLDHLLDCYSQAGGQARPNIAIVDWREVRTYNEFLMMQAMFEAAGYPTRIVDPRDLDYSGGRLRAEDYVIDLVYKRVVTSELLSREGLRTPLVRAVADGAVVMVNAFRGHLLIKKALFALLSDPQYGYLYTPEQRAAIARHIPWTRRVAHGHVEVQGRTVDLLEYAAQHRDHLVLKPSGEYGGQGVVLGWETTREEWAIALTQALDGVYVIQERVPIPQEDFPVLVDGQVRLEPRYLDLDPYVWQGLNVVGCGVRLSGGALLNVTAGGGSAVPMFVMRD